MKLQSDMEIKEACGVFGIFNPNGEDAASSVYYGLCSLQHRGQESCGIARERVSTHNVEEAILHTAKKIRGAYALVIASPRKLIGVHDPLGLKPLCLGKRDSSYIIASESCALSAIGAEFIRDIRPGEILTITADGITSNCQLCRETHAHCIFEYIYFARLDSTLDGVNVYDARIRAGAALAAAYPVDADLVTGVPDSGIPAAKGYSEASGIPFALAFYKNSYVGRTFIKPTQKERELSVRLKLNVLEPLCTVNVLSLLTTPSSEAQP